MPEPKFKKGDRVRVLDKKKDPRWNDARDKFIGKILTIESPQPGNWYWLAETRWGMEEEWLELVEASKDEIETLPNGAKQTKVLGAYHVLPQAAIQQVAETMAEALPKYGRDNWRGIPAESHYNHAIEHLMKWAETGNLEELSHGVTRALFVLEKVLRPDFEGKKESKQ